MVLNKVVAVAGVNPTGTHNAGVDAAGLNRTLAIAAWFGP